MTDNLIFAYTRAQAIADGVLVDVSELAKEAGFRFPVAVTAGVWARPDYDWRAADECGPYFGGARSDVAPSLPDQAVGQRVWEASQQPQGTNRG